MTPFLSSTLRWRWARFDTTCEFATWEESMQALKPKFLLHTVEYQPLAETQTWQMHGDWPQFHAIILTYKLFISAYFHGTPLINTLKALDHYLQRKVIKESKPATLEEAIERTRGPTPSATATGCPISCDIVRPGSCHASTCVHISARSNGIVHFAPGELASERFLIRSRSPRLPKLWSRPPTLQCIFRQA